MTSFEKDVMSEFAPNVFTWIMCVLGFVPGNSFLYSQYQPIFTAIYLVCLAKFIYRYNGYIDSLTPISCDQEE